MNYDQPKMALSKLIRSACIFVTFALFMFSMPLGALRAEEPFSRFLEQLKQNQLFDLAIVYLDQSAAAGFLTEEQKADLPLDRIVIAQESLVYAKSIQQREAKAAKVEAELRAFLDQNANHPRRSEARLKLADILLSRGQELLTKGEVEKVKARGDFQQARTLFEGTLAELRPLLESMQGAKIEANDRAKLAMRERYQGEYRQAEILMAYCGKLLADTFPPDAPDFNAWLTKAEAEFTEVIKKTTGAKEAGRHILSLLYRGQVQSALKKVDEALDSFIRVADIEEEGVFRTWRVQATTEIVKLLANAEQKKFEAAFDRADRLFKTAQSNEKLEPEWVELQFAMVEGKLAWSDYMAGQPNGDARSKSLKSEARAALQPLARRSGPQQEKAREMLAALGVEVKDKTDGKLPEVNDFESAYKALKEKLDESRDFALQLEVLETRRSEVDQEQQVTIDQEISRSKAEAMDVYDQALQLAQSAVRLYKAGDNREDLLQTRYFLAFVLVKLERYWESSAVADFTARASLGADIGQKAGGLALYSYRKLMDASPQERKASFQMTIESLSKYLLETWPAAEETRAAVINLIQLALESSNWADAERYLKMLPSDSVEYGKIARDLGFIQWANLLQTLDAKKKAGEAPGPDEDESLKRCEFLLTEGWNTLSEETLDERAVQAAAALAKIYLNAEKIDKTLEVMNKEKVGPLQVVRNAPQLVPDAKVKLEVFRVNLRALVMSASKGGQDVQADVIRGLIDEMQQTATDPKQMVSNLVVLAQELIEQLRTTTDANAKAKLADLVTLLLDKAIDVSEEVDILEWVGKTLQSLATELKDIPALAPKGQVMAQSAEKAISKLLELAKKDPSMLDDKKREQLEILQSLAARNRGDFKTSVGTLTAVLRKNNLMFLAQIEAARTYQMWGEQAKSADYFKNAMLGAEMDNAKRANVVWGWGRISQRLAQQPNLQDYFFESRYNLAYCRYEIAKLAAAPADRQKGTEQAYGDIKTTALNFPELGGQKWQAKFDGLLRQIQRDLKKEQVGIQEFKKK